MRLLPILFLAAALTAGCNSKPKENPFKEKAPEPVEGKSNLNRAPQPGELYHDITYYPDGHKIKMEGNMIDGKKEGKWTSYYENGLPWSETNFKNGFKEGPTTTWHPSGAKNYEGFYSNNARSGKWSFYNEQGKLIKEENF